LNPCPFETHLTVIHTKSTAFSVPLSGKIALIF